MQFTFTEVDEFFYGPTTEWYISKMSSVHKMINRPRSEEHVSVFKVNTK